jgi:hypothetical protein
MAEQHKRKRPIGGMIKIGAVVLFVVLVGVSSLLHLRSAKKEAAEIAAAWTVTGPACPTPAPGAVVAPPAKALQYMEGVTIAREMGPISCNTIREGGEGPEVPVCMLLGPRTTRVTTAKGTFDFVPPPGENVSIYIRDGEPSCVMNINRAVLQ